MKLTAESENAQLLAEFAKLPSQYYTPNIKEEAVQDVKPEPSNARVKLEPAEGHIPLHSFANTNSSTSRQATNEVGPPATIRVKPEPQDDAGIFLRSLGLTSRGQSIY
ncbi:hypothetical protein H0H81_008142 [Sphagnurus paluster]|uniref:Uncharacterized protein n=1 Tax=Sphagnurus paluster TaxID=117069 RepID=A0A9P7GN64_9AGAR|nr:hypothetical protein H0H81_008142 [Sphagnurus paluster]